MQLLIDCPHCCAEQVAPCDITDYDWESEVSLGGRADIDCENCGKEIKLEARGAIADIKVLH